MTYFLIAAPFIGVALLFGVLALNRKLMPLTQVDSSDENVEVQKTAGVLARAVAAVIREDRANNQRDMTIVSKALENLNTRIGSLTTRSTFAMADVAERSGRVVVRSGVPLPGGVESSGFSATAVGPTYAAVATEGASPLRQLDDLIRGMQDERA